MINWARCHAPVRTYFQRKMLTLSRNVCWWNYFPHAWTMKTTVRNLKVMRIGISLIVRLERLTSSHFAHSYLDFEDKTFQEYLASKKLTPKLNHYILHAISMSNTETSFKVGLTRTNKFLSSLGRYGNTPFLFPMYGCGEIPQCFCR